MTLCNLSHGMEKVPILFAGSCTPLSVSPLDTDYTYVCSPILHQSVSVEALAAAYYVHMFPLCTSGRNSGLPGGVISSWEENAGSTYLDDSTLHLWYIKQVSAGFSLPIPHVITS